MVCSIKLLEGLLTRQVIFKRKLEPKVTSSQQNANQFLCITGRGGHTFSPQAQTVNTLGFASHAISVATTQLCHESTKAAIGNTKTLSIKQAMG